MSESNRTRGILAFPMPESVGGPAIFGRYALVVHPTRPEARMVHTEGVAYLVNAEKPWRWSDYDPTVESVSLHDLVKAAGDVEPVDLADWVRSFGHRLESNFNQIAWWASND